MQNNPQLHLELALQHQRRLLEQPVPLREQPTDLQPARPIRSALGRMLIAVGLRLAPASKTSSQFQTSRATAS